MRSPSISPSRVAFCSSAGVLALEVSLTRIFSVILWYHFGFMIVSLAMLGFALAGAAVHARKSKIGGERVLSGGGNLLAAALIIPLVIALTRVPLDPTRLLDQTSTMLLFGLVVILAALPFFLLGYSLCSALEAGRARINRVYGFSFLGGAAGVGLGLLGMETLGGGGGVLLAAAAVWAGGATGPAAGLRPFAQTTVSLVLAAASVLLVPGIVPERSQKHFPNVPPEQVIDRQWNAFSSVLFYQNPMRHGLWAMPAGFRGPLPEMVGIAIDEWAITSIVRFDGDLSGLGFFEAYPPTLGLVAAPRAFEALVIGAGGGLDVLGALYFGAKHVQAVELNPLIVEAVMGRFSDYSGNLYHDERVTAVAAEGRHFVERDTRQYDRIILTGVDTFAATAAGAYALSENFIYTVEAFQAYLKRLKPQGLIGMTRWFYEPPRQTLRLVAAAREALVREGVAEPDRCFFLARAKLRSLILVKKTPFTLEERTALLAGLAPREAALIYCEGIEGHPVVSRFFTDRGRAEMASEYPYRVDAPTDDCPFLFEHTRWENLFAGEQDWFMDRLGGLELLFLTFAALIGCFGLGLLAIRMVFCKRKSSGVASTPSGRFRLGAAFFLIGAGYLTAEAALLPKICLSLGHPVHAMSLVLVSLLIFSGLGAMWSRRIAARPRNVLVVCLIAVAALPIFFQIIAGLLAEPLAHASFWPRLLMLWCLLAVPGFCLGIPFPLAIRTFTENAEALVARAFLFNGVGSALACPAATALAITLGFDRTFSIAAALYLIAGFLMASVARPSKMKP